jgi:prepilin-type N-terminal cleavage/methylation domain-containing protein
MKSRSTLTRASGLTPPARSSAGFTVIEVLIVLALFTVVAGLGITLTLRPYRSAGIAGERDLVISLLSRARSRAMGNDGGVPHGFCYDEHANLYEVFALPYSGATREERGTKSGSVSVSGVPDCGSGSELLFAQLSGTTSPTEIYLSEGDASTSIDINAAGAVLW